MPEFTVSAFKWTGTYYNAEYETSYEVTFNDDDGTYEGGRDASETVSIDGGAEQSTWSEPYCIDVSFTDTDGEPHVETFYFFNAEGDWYFVPSAETEFSEGAKLGTYQSHTNGWDYKSTVCFASGTRILTEFGERPVEDLCPGDRVQRIDGGLSQLKINLRCDVSAMELWANDKLVPVRISQGALGPGLPNRTLWVSRQHRMLVSSNIANRMFGTPKVLVAAHKLTSLPGVFLDRKKSGFSYHHLVFSEHQVIFANGAPSESFFPGPQALSTISLDAKDEVTKLFPGISRLDVGASPVVPVPPPPQQKRLVARHRKNALALVQM